MDGIELIKRKYFEDVVISNFRKTNIGRNHRGEYTDPTIEDHWQTFLEGWDSAMDFIRKRTNYD